MSFELGPLQKTWVEALKSGKFKQGTKTLKIPLDNGEFSYCCLGVANEVCNLGEKHPDYLHDSFLKLGLRDNEGMPKSGISGKQLTVINDNGKSFKDIAELLESDPEEYFSESK